MVRAHYSTISLECKDAGQWTGMSEVNCAIVAAADAVYNVGLVVIEEACMGCRAGGTPGEVDVREVVIDWILHVDSKELYIVMPIG